MTTNIHVIGTLFTGTVRYGDFKHMITSGKYNDSLFIYNDNEESYYMRSYRAGAGNAIIRRYNQYNGEYSDNPLSAGIPTGTLENGGYESLNEENKEIIDKCILNITNLITKHNKKRLFYSAKNKTGVLGTGIFEVSDDVLEYVTNEIFKLTNKEIYIINHVDKTSFHKDDTKEEIN